MRSISSLPSNLKELDITNLSLTGTAGFTSLSALTNLQTLKIGNTILDSINFVSSMENLAKIEANNCQVSDM